MTSSAGCLRLSSRENPWALSLPHPTVPATARACNRLIARTRIVGDEHHGSIVSAGVIPEDVVGSIMISPCSNADTPMASTTSSWELNAQSAPQMKPGSSSSASHAQSESGMGGLGDTDVFDGAVEGCSGGVFSGLVAQVPDMALTSSGLRDVDGTTRETGDDTIAEADWLDVTLLCYMQSTSPAL